MKNSLRFFFLIISVSALFVGIAFSQTSTQGPQWHLARCTGANNVQVCTLPVVTTVTGATSTTTLLTITTNFVVNNNGELFTVGTVITKGPDNSGSTGGSTGSGGGAFRAGLYQQVTPVPTSRDNEAFLVVTAPTSGNLWVASVPADAKCGLPQGATWYAGVPVNEHPLATRLVAAGITSNTFSYGTGGGVDNGICIGASTGFRQWYPADSILGVIQPNQETLVFVSFTNRDNRNKTNVPDAWEDDQATPGGTVTYKYVGPLPPTTP